LQMKKYFTKKAVSGYGMGKISGRLLKIRSKSVIYSLY